VVRTKDTKEIVPNNLIQGVVRPDPMTTLMLENLQRQDQAKTTGKTWADLAASWFAGNKAQAAPTPAPTAAPGGATAPPKIGDVVQGYKFKGGDPADPKNWEQVQ
jgi:hypothetical protein